MDERRSRFRLLVVALGGLAMGGLASTLVLIVTGAAVAHRAHPRTLEAAGPLDAAHVPPLLRSAGEAAELRYDIYCSAPSDVEDEVPCSPGGTVYARAGTSGPFRAFPIHADPAAVEGRYVARIAPEVAGTPLGFTYYAVLSEATRAGSLTIPAAGAAAPLRSLPLGRPVSVSLGPHTFGAVRVPDARVVSAAWGSGVGEVGLEESRQSTPIGGSAFDVDAAGSVTVFDEANRRALRFRPGSNSPDTIALAVSGRLADMSVAPDGAIYVLESPGSDAPLPVLRAFDPTGNPKESVALAERTASAVRAGPSGPVALQYPSGQWMPVGSAGGLIGNAAQRAGGRSGRPLPGGGEVVVLRQGTGELRAAIVAASGALRSWRVQSSTPLAEVQLAEPLGNRLVLVVRVYTDAKAEFIVLVLGNTGVVKRFSVASSDWAETAPLARFRLVGSSLYQLGSTPDGLFVDRYHLGVSP
jgi:hypothetical protein